MTDSMTGADWLDLCLSFRLNQIILQVRDSSTHTQKADIARNRYCTFSSEGGEDWAGYVQLS
jgi:hypothetical protein